MGTPDTTTLTSLNALFFKVKYINSVVRCNEVFSNAKLYHSYINQTNMYMGTMFLTKSFVALIVSF